MIGRATTPRCFKGLKDKKMPHGLPYYNNPKAWMNSEVMDAILTKLNRRLIKEKRKVILFMDNVSSHTPDLKEKLKLYSYHWNY